MRDPRWVTGAGLAALAAVVAHAGPAGVTDGRSLAIAGAAAAIAAVGLSSAASRVAGARHRAADALNGAGGSSIDHVQVPFSAVVATMLVLQGAAHVGLLLAGVHAGGGVAAAPALHVVLAIAAAWVVVVSDRMVTSAIASLNAVVSGLIQLLTAVRPRLAPAPVLIPARPPRNRPFPGRAPPRGR
jgi:hypothetical protein